MLSRHPYIVICNFCNNFRNILGGVGVKGMTTNEEDIVDMVEPTNIEHHYSPQTYWEPGEDYISCDYELDEEFNKVVQIAEFHYFDEEEPFAVVINDNTYCLGEKEGWMDVLKSLGWVFFDNDFDMEDKEDIVKCNLEDWLDSIANEKAWKYIEDDSEDY